MATKTFNTRIALRYDSYENWIANDPVLMAGEVALAYVSVKQDGEVQHVPSVLIKCGDNEHKYSELDYVYAKAADVLTACKSEEALTAFINNVIANAGIATDEAMQALSDRVGTAEGKIATLESDLNTAETGLKAKVAAQAAAIAAIEGKFGAENVASEITAAINALNLPGTYEAKGEAAKVQGALETYINSNDAAMQTNTNAITANTNAIAAIKDGTKMDSFADVEAALDGKEAAGAAAQALTDAKAYADGLAGNYDAKGAAAAAETAAKEYAKNYADGLAGNYDEAGAADAALEAAKEYVDGLTGGDSVSDYVAGVIADYSTTEQMNAAIATAKGEAVTHANGLNTAMDERVQALEAIDHTHTFVESELNLIKAGDVEKWNAAEQNAIDHADGLDEAMDVRVKALEAKFGDGEGNVESQIEAAVAAEAKLREEADAGLQEQVTENAEAIEALGGELTRLTGGAVVSDAIAAAVKVETDRATGVEAGLETRLKAVEDTYATDEDVAGLQTQINTIMSNPDAEGAINSINEFTAYINEHKPIAEAFRTDINKNKDDIAAEVDRATKAEAALQGAIDGVAGDLTTLSGVVDTKAAQADLDTLEGRVDDLEAELDTAETGLKARMATAEADIDAIEQNIADLTGGTKVSDAIAAVTGPMIERIVELEKVDHDHANKEELDKIVAGDKAKWDAAVQTVTAGTGLKATKTGTEVAIDFDDTVVFIFDCGTSV